MRTRRATGQRHLFNEDPEFPESCLDCPLPRANQVHLLPERSDEERATTARMVGERA